MKTDLSNYVFNKLCIINAQSIQNVVIADVCVAGWQFCAQPNLPGKSHLPWGHVKPTKTLEMILLRVKPIFGFLQTYHWGVGVPNSH